MVRVDSKEKRIQTGPTHYEGNKTMKTPVTGAKLYPFLHCWWQISTDITEMHEKMQALNVILGKPYAVARKRRKSALKTIALQKLSYGVIHHEALLAILDNLRQSVKLPFSKKDHVICVSTDPFDAFLAAFVIQTK